jgi:hypothetical protein
MEGPNVKKGGWWDPDPDQIDTDMDMNLDAEPQHCMVPNKKEYLLLTLNFITYPERRIFRRVPR